jgi:oligoendopeptidase F
MLKRHGFPGILGVFLFCMTTSLSSADNDRTVWDLTPLFADAAAWEDARAPMLEEIRAVARHRETFLESPSALADYMEEVQALSLRLSRLWSWPSLRLAADTRSAEDVERMQRLRVLSTEFSRATSWFRPMLLEKGEAFVEEALAREPRLAQWAHPLRDTLRLKDQTYSEVVEGVLALISPVWRGTSSVYSTFTNADFPWPEITLSTGESVRLTTANYQRVRQSPVRADRRLATEAFLGAYADFERTFGEMYFGNVLNMVTSSRLRKHPSALAQRFFSENLPPAVYHTLIAEVHAALPVLHRYLKLRRDLLGLDELAYFDLSQPLVESGKTFDFDLSMELTKRSAKPLGTEYMERLERGLSGRFMHVFPAEGKRSGAFMSGAVYDAHPYVFLNHIDTFTSLSTMAHEWGHAIHSVLSNESQPPATARYSLFIAEIAAFTNEYLLYHYMQENARTPEERLFYLLEEIDHKRGAYFRQTKFAEFELLAHSAVERDEPLSGQRMTSMYRDLLHQYFGHEEGVVRIDDAFAVEWSVVPHFYSNFYVYNYATSTAAASYFTARILEGCEETLENYLNLLRAGGRDFPYDLVLAAGLDMASPDPYVAIRERLETLVGEVERLVEEHPGLRTVIAERAASVEVGQD